MKPYNVFAIILPGLENLAADELQELGIKKLNVEKGGISFHCHPRKLLELNYLSRIVNRFLVRIHSFKASSFSEFEKNFKPDLLKPFLNDSKIKLKTSLRKSKLYHSGAVEERFLKFSQCTLSKKDNAPEFYIHAEDNIFTISINSSGESLYKRGHISHSVTAPLRETLAAAMLRASGIQKSLWDPMCGRGTLGIEYLNLPPKRSFTMSQWKVISENDLKHIEEVVSRFDHNTSITIYLSDINPDAVEATRHNVTSLQNNHITVFEHDINNKQSTQIKTHPDVIICNMPYGKRIQHEKPTFKALQQLAKHHNAKLFVLFPSGFIHEGWTKRFSCRNGGVMVSFCEWTGISY